MKLFDVKFPFNCISVPHWNQLVSGSCCQHPTPGRQVTVRFSQSCSLWCWLIL